MDASSHDNRRADPGSRAGGIAKVVLANVALLLLMVTLVEGGSSLLLFFRNAQWRGATAESLYTRHDPELGWVAIPNISRPDFYGPGLALTTNSRGFRDTREVSNAQTAGKQRVICSGDSFTLGYGVADDQTWCHLLEVKDPALETVNMGQGGYGIDQAYLWLRRDGAQLDHRYLVFAFITDDFRRMRVREFFGYSKPWLDLNAAGGLLVRNTPVPTASYGALSWITRNMDSIRQLRSVELAEGVVRRVVGESVPAGGGEVLTPERAQAVLRAVLQDLQRISREKQSTLLLVHLPTPYELDKGGRREWADVVSTEAEQLGIRHLDTFGAFSALTSDERARMFLKPGDVTFPGAVGHFTAAGNRLAADLVHAALTDASPAAP